MMAPVLVRVFLSSPSDVLPERDAAEKVLARINGIFHGYVKLSLERWERDYFEATKTFQEGIASMEGFDLVVGIFWKRLGTELPPGKFCRKDGKSFESGTVFEIESAIDASLKNKKPSVYVFKKQAPVLYTEAGVDEEKRQKLLLDGWWTTFFHDEKGRHIAAANFFNDERDFENRFEDFLVKWLTASGYLSNQPVWDVNTKGSPYPGLVSYDLSRSSVFFGREYAIEQALEEWRIARSQGRLPFLFILGASGSGKSSLVKAGILPRLLTVAGEYGRKSWRVTAFEPSSDSLVSFAKEIYSEKVLPELATGSLKTAERWAKLAAESPDAAADAILWALDKIGPEDDHNTSGLIIVIDQLELVFSSENGKAFLRIIRLLVDSLRIWFVVTLRSDRYAELLASPDLLDLKRTGICYDLPPPGKAEIREIIKAPARAAGLTFENEEGQSLAQIIEESASTADSLPLLQMTLSQLYERRSGDILTFSSYRMIGGVAGAIATHAEQTFTRTPSAAQKTLPLLLGRLVGDVSKRGDGSLRFTLRTVRQADLTKSQLINELSRTMIESRLLISDKGEVRVAHEALLRQWQRASKIVRSIADAQIRALKRRFLFLAVTAAMFVVVALAALFLGGLSFSLYKQSNEHLSLALLTKADQYLTSDKPTRAASLVNQLDKRRGRYTPFLSNFLGTDQSDRQIGIRMESIRAVAQPAASRPIWAVFGSSAATSLVEGAGGKIIAGYRNGEIKLVDKKGGEESYQLGDGPILEVVFEASRNIAFVATDKHIFRWDTVSNSVQELCTSSAEVTDIALSPDGTYVGWSSKDGTVNIIDIDTNLIKKYQSNIKWTLGIDFSYDSKVLASVGDDGSVLFRNIGSGTVSQPLTIDNRDVWSIALSQDGSRIFTAAISGDVKVWNPKDAGQKSKELLPKSRDKRWRIKASPDGRYVAVASWDGTVTLIDQNSYQPVATIDANDGRINDVAFSHDSQSILTAGESGVLKRWNINGLKSMFFTASTAANENIVASYDKTGTKFASGGSNGQVSVYDVTKDGRLTERCVVDIKDWVLSVSYSFDSSILFVVRAADIDRPDEPVLRMLNSTTCQPLPEKIPQSGYISVAISSPHDATVAWGTSAGNLFIYNYLTKVPVIVMPMEAAITDIAIAGDGSQLAVTTDTGKAFLVDLTNFTKRSMKRNGDDYLNTVKFSPNGKLIAAGGSKGYLEIWKTDRPDVLFKQLSIPGGTNNIAFSQDNNYLAAGSDARYLAAWSIEDWKQHFLLTAGVGVRSVYGFNPRTRDLAYDGGDSTIRIIPAFLRTGENGFLEGTLIGADITFDLQPNEESHQARLDFTHTVATCAKIELHEAHSSLPLQ